jgi:hypothetical protein
VTTAPHTRAIELRRHVPADWHTLELSQGNRAASTMYLLSDLGRSALSTMNIQIFIPIRGITHEPIYPPNSHCEKAHFATLVGRQGDDMLSHRRPAPILFVLFAISLTTACASTGRHWSGLVQRQPNVHHSEVIPGSREKIEALQPGAALVVTLKTGQRLEGALKAAGPSVLTLTDRGGKELSIQMSQIDRIVALGTRDSLTNGIGIGAGIGFGAALAVLAAVGSQDGYVLPSAKVGAPLLLSGVGGLVGAFVDRARESDQVLYRAR